MNAESKFISGKEIKAFARLVLMMDTILRYDDDELENMVVTFINGENGLEARIYTRR